MATPNIVPRADQEGGLGTSAKSWGKLFIENPSSGGTAAVTISNLDNDQVALDIDAPNTTGNVIDIATTQLSTGDIIFIDNNNASTTGNVSSNFIDIDYDKTAVTGDGNTNTTNGIVLNMADGATNHANASVTQIGANINISSSSDQGTISNTGMSIQVTGGDTATGITMRNTDGGDDIKMSSSANASDYSVIKTGTNGALTIATVDADSAVAHMTLDADGDITLDPAGRNIYFAYNGTNVIDFDVNGQVMKIMDANTDSGDYMYIQVENDGVTNFLTNDDDGTGADLKFNIDGDIQMFNKSADYAQTISYGVGKHHVYAELELTDANTTDHGVIKQLPGIKIPQYATIKDIHVTITELSNLTNYNVEVTIGTNDGVSAGSVPANYHQLIGAGVNYSYHTDDVNGLADIEMGSGSGNLKKSVWNSRMMDVMGSDGELTADHYVYVCSAGTSNATTDATAGKVYIYIEYFGMD